MPIIQIYSPLPSPPEGLSRDLCAKVAEILSLPDGHTWAFWNEVSPGKFYRPDWENSQSPSAPVVFLYCKSKYSREQVIEVMHALRDSLASAVNCDPDAVFIGVLRIRPFELLVRGEVWRGEDSAAASHESIVIEPIGIVHSPRIDLSDDNWGDVVSVIELDPNKSNEDSLAGLERFSHIEVIFYFHRVPDEKIQSGTRPPRGRTDWPKVGIFAQRAKGRPNRLGVSRCKLLKVEGLRLTVLALDAIDGTPVLDIKPYMVEFGPRGGIEQPQWSTELMEHYYDQG